MVGKRGQAFDTFKLMIAAVVAVAILGILLSILGSISIPGVQFSNTVPSLLSQALQLPGNVYSSAGEVQFQPNEQYVSDAFTQSTGGKPVTFICSSELGPKDLASPAKTSDGPCKAGKAVTGGIEGTTTLTTTGQFKAKVYACCKADKCQISIGPQADVSKVCPQ
ncbi:hypothetical protein HYS54_04220 [Candidatus Micrarchaeota archaeon]|nr:hypothetical protein [Candidatus Micrarchaeota archaeon]